MAVRRAQLGPLNQLATCGNFCGPPRESARISRQYLFLDDWNRSALQDFFCLPWNCGKSTRERSPRKNPSALLERKRIEIGSPVKRIDPFHMFEPPNDDVGQQCGKRFINNLEALRRSDHGHDLPMRHHAPKCYENQQNRVDKLPGDC